MPSEFRGGARAHVAIREPRCVMTTCSGLSPPGYGCSRTLVATTGRKSAISASSLRRVYDLSEVVDKRAQYVALQPTVGGCRPVIGRPAAHRIGRHDVPFRPNFEGARSNVILSAGSVILPEYAPRLTGLPARPAVGARTRWVPRAIGSQSASVQRKAGDRIVRETAHAEPPRDPMSTIPAPYDSVLTVLRRATIVTIGDCDAE